MTAPGSAPLPGRFGWRTAGLAFVLVTAGSSPAQAQVAAPAPTAAARAPVPQGSTDVPYPAGASGDALVALELVVEADGTVSSAVVTDGAEPFATQARRAVLGWRFTPAYREDTPIAARIRARVAFHQATRAPPPSVAGPPASPTPPAPARTAVPPPATATASPPESALEVTVRGYRHEIGETTLSAAEVRELPGAFGDPFRVIEALPGVTPILSGLPYFYIRGAPPNDNAFLVDDIRVPLLFHLGIGQGVIHPGLIDHLDFFPGAPPARYGGSAGAIIAGQTRDPAAAPHGEANLRLLDAGALLETPFDQGRGSALVAGRYGYPGPILGAITSGLTLEYWDYQARVTWRLNGRDTLQIFAFGSHDALVTPSPSGDPTAVPIEQFVSDFHRVDLRYDHALADGNVRLAVTAGHDRQGAAPTHVGDSSGAARVQLGRKLSPRLRLRAGAEAHFDAYRFTQSATRPGDAVVPSTADPPPTNQTVGAHADVVWRVTPRVEIVPGARFEVFASSRANAPAGSSRVHTIVPAFDPRVSARITLGARVAWLSSFGLSHQYPTLRAGDIPAPLVSVPGFPYGVTRLQTALQASEGGEVVLPADLVLTATGFLSRWSGLTDLTAMCFQIIPGAGIQTAPGQPLPYQCPGNQPINGRAYGLELLLRRPLSKRLSGWLSYTLSRSTREAHFLTPAGGDALATVPDQGDHTHVLNAILAYDLGRRWRAGGRFVYFTGGPYSPTDGTLPVPPYNSLRFPSFFRLDVRLEKRWSLGRDATLALVVEGQNVTLSKEWFGGCQIMDTPEMSSARCRPDTVGPITLPSVGIEAFF